MKGRSLVWVLAGVMIVLGGLVVFLLGRMSAEPAGTADGGRGGVVSEAEPTRPLSSRAEAPRPAVPAARGETPAPVSAAPDHARRDVVPVRFRGEWNANLEDCGTGLNDSRLRITADRIQFYESGGPIKAVSGRGEFEISIIAELAGEGAAWDAVHRFRLSSDHKTLIDVTGGDEFVRYRCPGR